MSSNTRVWKPGSCPIDGTGFMFRERLMCYQGNDKFADCLFVCDNHVVKGHRVIVCAHSSVLNAALTRQVKETPLYTYEFKDDKWALVRRMLSSFYHGYYIDADEYGDDPDEPSSNWVLDINLLLLAHKYEAEELFWIAERQVNQWLQDKDVEAAELLDSIPIIYYGPECMKRFRNNIVSYTGYILTTMQDDHSNMEKYRSVCRQVPEFALEMLFYFSTNLPQSLKLEPISSPQRAFTPSLDYAEL